MICTQLLYRWIRRMKDKADTSLIGEYTFQICFNRESEQCAGVNGLITTRRITSAHLIA